MGLCILCIDEMGVVGGYDFYTVFAGKVYQHGVDLLLLHKGLAVGTRDICLVALELDIVVIAECLLEPENLSLGFGYVPFGYKAGNFSTETRRTDNQTFAASASLSVRG